MASPITLAVMTVTGDEADGFPGDGRPSCASVTSAATSYGT